MMGFGLSRDASFPLPANVHTLPSVPSPQHEYVAAPVISRKRTAAATSMRARSLPPQAIATPRFLRGVEFPTLSIAIYFGWRAQRKGKETKSCEIRTKANKKSVGWRGVKAHERERAKELELKSYGGRIVAADE